MDKKKYYVSVQANTIMERQGDAAYELEIIASEEEITKLKELFDYMEEFDRASYYRAHIPGIPYHHDIENDGYDYYLAEAYKLMHELGTDETKRFISSINERIETMGGINE